jgi:hypothetical protein
MKHIFPGYYRPTKEKLAELWKKSLFALDANVLLNLYRYSPETSTELLGILTQVSKRLWVPHQAALEYQRNRLNVIFQQREAYTEIEEFLQKIQNQIETKLNAYRRHPYIDVRHLTTLINSIFSKINEELLESSSKHPDLLEHDDLREAITALLEEKVGSSYSKEKLISIYKEGEERYKHNIPPGYSDSKTKDGEEKYGDLVLWFQIMDKAKETQTSVILVNDDAKEDWWWKFKGRTIAPRPELVEEMINSANVSFYMYPSDIFMEYAREYLKQQVDQQAIDEVRNIRKQDEAMRDQHSLLLRELDQTRNVRAMLTHEMDHIKKQLSEVKQEIESKSVKIDETTSPDIGEKRDRLLALEGYLEDLRVQEKILEQRYAQTLAEENYTEHKLGEIQRRLEKISLEGNATK